jgi:hypothetical protein
VKLPPFSLCLRPSPTFKYYRRKIGPHIRSACISTFAIPGGRMYAPLARALDYAMAMDLAMTSYISRLSRIIDEG